MSRFSTDPDDDDIKRILESMWEKTSHIEPGERRPFARSTSYDIDLDRTQDSRDGSAPRPRRRLIDALYDVGLAEEDVMAQSFPKFPYEISADELQDAPPPDDLGDGDTADTQSSASKQSQLELRAKSSVATQQQLSSLSYQGDGHDEAASETAMQTQSTPPTPESESQPVNGNSHDLGSQHRDDQILDVTPVETPLHSDSADAGPTEGVPAQSAPAKQAPASAQAAEKTEPKRQMASFFDKRMMHMADGAGEQAASNAAVSTPPIIQEPKQAEPDRAATPTAQNSGAATPPAQAAMPQANATPGDPASATSESAAELMRPVLRQWLGENMPKIVGSALQIEAAEQAHIDDTKKSDK